MVTSSAALQAARAASAPICMVLSGGYARGNYAVISKSIARLLRKYKPPCD